MYKLFIDTSTQVLILILQGENEIIDYIFDITKNNHSEKLMPAIKRLLEKNNILINSISAIYVTEGPGSYTGVRIGVTVAKTLAYSLDIPLYKISTLKVISSPYFKDETYILPLIDARRNNVFSCLYKVEGNKLVSVIDEKLYDFNELLRLVKKETDNSVLVVGFDCDKFKHIDKQFEFINSFVEDFSFDNVLNVLNFQLVEDIHTFVPSYKRLPEAERNLL